MIQIAPIADKKMTYDEALLYCRFLEYDGHTDWRMPNMFDWHQNTIEVWGWLYDADLYSGNDFKLHITPVRDIK